MLVTTTPVVLDDNQAPGPFTEPTQALLRKALESLPGVVRVEFPTDQSVRGLHPVRITLEKFRHRQTPWGLEVVDGAETSRRRRMAADGAANLIRSFFAQPVPVLFIDG